MRKWGKLSLQLVFMFAFMWFILAIIFDAWPFNQRPEGNIWKTISNLEYGFSVNYPTRWIGKVYGEHGIRGIDEAKLRINDRSSRNIFAITVYYFEKIDPTLEDVASWGDLRIGSGNRRLTDRGEDSLEIIDEWNDEINGEPILRRKYGGGTQMMEDVYLARENDMIIITLQATAREFDQYKSDFDKIVASFNPVN